MFSNPPVGINFSTTMFNIVPFGFIFKFCEVLNTRMQLGTSISQIEIFALFFQHVKYFLLKITVFMPFGLLLPIISNKKSIYQAIYLGLIVAISIELLQFILMITMMASNKIINIDDILAGCIGAVIGWIIYRFIISPKLKLDQKSF